MARFNQRLDRSKRWRFQEGTRELSAGQLTPLITISEPTNDAVAWHFVDPHTVCPCPSQHVTVTGVGPTIAARFVGPERLDAVIQLNAKRIKTLHRPAGANNERAPNSTRAPRNSSSDSRMKSQCCAAVSGNRQRFGSTMYTGSTGPRSAAAASDW